MKIIITSFITAVDKKDPKKGNKRKYSVLVAENGGEKNFPVENWEVSGLVSELIWKQTIKDLGKYKSTKD